MSKMVMINPFEVPEGREEEFLGRWEKFAAYVRKQPGFVSIKLYQSLRADARFRFVNMVEWESLEHFEASLTDEFRELTAPARERFTYFPAPYEVIRT